MGVALDFNLRLGDVCGVLGADLPVKFCSVEHLSELAGLESVGAVGGAKSAENTENSFGEKIALVLTTPYCGGAFGPLAARNTYVVDRNKNFAALSPVKALDASQDEIQRFLAQKGAIGCMVDPSLINYQVEQIIEQKKVYSRRDARSRFPGPQGS